MLICKIKPNSRYTTCDNLVIRHTDAKRSCTPHDNLNWTKWQVTKTSCETVTVDLCRIIIFMLRQTFYNEEKIMVCVLQWFSSVIRTVAGQCAFCFAPRTATWLTVTLFSSREIWGLMNGLGINTSMTRKIGHIVGKHSTPLSRSIKADFKKKP